MSKRVLHEIDSQLARFAATWAASLGTSDTTHLVSLAASFSLDQLVRNPEAMAAAYLISQTTTAGQSTSSRDSVLDEYLLRLPDSTVLPGSRGMVVIAAATIGVHLRRGDSAQAVAVADAALSALTELSESDLATISRELTWLWVMAGRAHYANGSIEPAAALWTAALDSDPTGYPRFQALCSLSVVAGTAGSNLRAKILADEAITLGRSRNWLHGDPAGDVFLGRGVAGAGMLDLESMDSSLAELRKIVGMDPASELLINSLQNIALALRGEFDAVTANLTEIAHRLEVDHATELVRYSIVYAQAYNQILAGNAGGAVVMMDQHADAYPFTAEFTALRGCAYLSFGLPRRALATVSELIKAEVGDGRVGINVALAVSAAADLLLGRTDEAHLTFMAMIDRVPEFGAYGMTVIPKSILERLIEEARERGVDVPPTVTLAHDLPSNRLDAVLSTVGSLTRSERALLLELRDHGTLDEIAERTYAARNTVKTHSRRLYSKLGVSTREEAVDLAETVGFFESSVAMTDSAASRKRIARRTSTTES